MNTEIKEQLSALMDGEAERESTRFVLRSVQSDAALSAAWSRYHVTRDCLRRQPLLLVGGDFSATVMARIDAESAASRATGGRWLRYVSGGAVAAAVAVVALISSSPTPTPPGSAVNTATAVAVNSRPTVFNDSLLQPRPPMLAQPASATVGGGGAFFAPGYDQRTQPANGGWRQIEPTVVGGRIGGAPYVLLIVPAQDPAAARSEPSARLH